MPGEVIELEGEARALVAAVIHLAGYDFALIGGLAVMVRLHEAHRDRHVRPSRRHRGPSG